MLPLSLYVELFFFSCQMRLYDKKCQTNTFGVPHD